MVSSWLLPVMRLPIPATALRAVATRPPPVRAEASRFSKFCCTRDSAAPLIEVSWSAPETRRSTVTLPAAVPVSTRVSVPPLALRASTPVPTFMDTVSLPLPVTMLLSPLPVVTVRSPV